MGAIDAGTTYVEIDSTDLSAQCQQSPALTKQKEEVDVTTFGATIRSMQTTLEQAVEMPFVFLVTSYDTGAAYAILNAKYDSGADIAVALRPTSAAASATNPEFQFTAKVTQCTPMAEAAPGGVHKLNVTIRRNSAITVDTGA